MDSTAQPGGPLDAPIDGELAAVTNSAEPSPPQAPAQSPSPVKPNGFRRAALTAGMAAALLVAGGVAAVSAASPDPAASPTPAASTEATDDGTTSSSSAESGDSTRGDCPNEDGSDATPDATPTPTS